MDNSHYQPSPQQENSMDKIKQAENTLLDAIADACDGINNRERNIAKTEIQSGVMWGIRAFMNPEK